MKRYLQDKFEYNHNLADARLAVLRGAVEILEKMKDFFTHEHLTKKGELKICYVSTIKDFLRKNTTTINNMDIRGCFYEEYSWQVLEFCRDYSYNEKFSFYLYTEKGSFIVDKKINLEMIENAKNHYMEKVVALEKHVKTRATLESQLLELADELTTKFNDLSVILHRWNQPNHDICECELAKKIR